MDADNGLIGNIQYFNVHDGNGLRTTVFFQGCNMRCKWCQNPEYQSTCPVLVNDEKRGMQYSAKEMSIEEILTACSKERFFFRYHGGGVTLSGGEPLLQRDFVFNLVMALKTEGYNVAVETAGYVPWESIDMISDYVDTFLWDVKMISKKLRKQWLGVSEEFDLDNLIRLSEKHKQIVIRIPLIPEVNDGEEFKKIIEFLKTINNLKYVQLLPFHQVGSEKYKKINGIYEMESHKHHTKEEINGYLEQLMSAGYTANVGGRGFTYIE